MDAVMMAVRRPTSKTFTVITNHECLVMNVTNQGCCGAESPILPVPQGGQANHDGDDITLVSSGWL